MLVTNGAPTSKSSISSISKFCRPEAKYAYKDGRLVTR